MRCTTRSSTRISIGTRSSRVERGASRRGKEAWTCPTCGEHWPEARSRDSALCQNCANTNSSVPLARCPICPRRNVPGQFHHSASQRQHPALGLHLCLNCHAILTHRQENMWRPDWKTEAHPLRCIVQGDIHLVCLLLLQKKKNSYSLQRHSF